VSARACFGVLSLFLFAIPAVAHAEAGSSTPTARCEDLSIATYVFGGTSGWDARALDARLASLGYSTFAQNPGSGGIGLRVWSDECSFTGAMELQFAMASANADAGRELSLVSGQLMFQVGRILYARRNIRSYAMLGLGYGGNVLTLDPGPQPARAKNPLGFADGSSGAMSYALTLQALVGLDVVVPVGPPRRFNALMVGLRAGYAAQPLVSSWSASSGSGSNAPTYPVDLPRFAEDGAFVHLVFGEAATRP
jgi:hypothetical protein